VSSTAASEARKSTSQVSTQITPEIRKWIVDQASAGIAPDVVLKTMVDSGWPEDVAIAALETTLHGHLVEHAKANNLPVPVRVPEPMVTPGQTVLHLPDRDVPVLASVMSPRVLVLGSFLSDEECDALIVGARAKMARSETVVPETGGSEVNEARTSQGMFYERGQTEVIKRIEARIAAMTDWPLVNGEGLQILHYRPGAEYKPHYDYFDPAQSGMAAVLKRGGQRVATLVMYLNTPEVGGGTSFPDIHMEVSAIKGNAVFFSYDRPHPMTKSLHGGAPVVKGEKWVATKWLREGRFD
jgi:prolyl 4-hydroxylase